MPERMGARRGFVRANDIAPTLKRPEMSKGSGPVAAGFTAPGRMEKHSGAAGPHEGSGAVFVWLAAGEGTAARSNDGFDAPGFHAL